MEIHPKYLTNKFPSLKTRVLEQVKDSADGLTVEDLEVLLSERENSIRPRLTELAKVGLVKVTGSRKNTRGKSQKVWAVAA